MQFQATIEDVCAYMSEHKTCVLATKGPDNRPQAATVGFSVNGRLELLIGMSEESRKAGNIRRFPWVAVVVTDESRNLTVQYEGEAALADELDLNSRMEAHLEQVPGAKRYLGRDDQVWFIVRPHLVRMSQGSGDGYEVVEFRQF